MLFEFIQETRLHPNIGKSSFFLIMCLLEDLSIIDSLAFVRHQQNG